jgi:hypothetical protein
MVHVPPQSKLLENQSLSHPQSTGQTVSADFFCAEITAGKSQRLKEITTAVGKSKYEF